MIKLALLVLSNFEDQRVEPRTYPSNRSKLHRKVRPAVEIVRVIEDLFCFFKSDASLGIVPQYLTLLGIEIKAHRMYNCYTIIGESPQIVQR